MPNMLEVGGQAPIMDPTEVVRRQQLAKMLMEGGRESAQAPRHWTQALGSILQTGIGSYQAGQAARGQAAGQASGNQALAQMLMGGDGKAAMANPYSADQAMKVKAAEQASARSLSNQERLMKMKLEAQNADPMRQLQMEKLRKEIQQVGAGGSAPSNVKEWQFFSSLPPDQQQRYLAMKRADPLDKAYAKQYGEDVLQGGNIDATKNLSQLTDAQRRLESGKENLTGPMLGAMPESLRAFTNPGSVDVQDTVRDVVQRNLRVILGAQFTQREGERLIASAFNPQLEEKDNAKRLARLNTAMEQAIKSKQEAAAYYQQNGTMRGFPGRTKWSVSDFEKAMEENTDQELPVITDPQQARTLPSGTRFKTPDGRVMEVP
jgi:hypothetical protein